MNCDRKLPASLSHRVEDTRQGRLGLKQVLRGLDQQHIDATLNQSRRLLLISRRHVVESDVPQGRKLRCWPNRTRHEPRLVRGGKLRGHFLRQSCRRNVYFRDLVLQFILGQHDARCSEGIGLHHVAPDFEEGRMNVLDEVGTAEHQQFVAPFLAPEIIHTGIAELDVGPHGAVVNHDAIPNGL